MMSGLALYGVKEISKSVVRAQTSTRKILTTFRTAGSRKYNSDDFQPATNVDPEHVEWLEWKRQSAQTKDSALYQPTRGQDSRLDKPTNYVHEYCSEQQLHLIQPQYGPPPYNHSSPQQKFQPLKFVSPRKIDFDSGSRGRGTSGNRKRSQWESLIDQGMDMLQARRGNDQIQKRRSAEI